MRTGLHAEHRAVTTPTITDLRLTIPAREALLAAGNVVSEYRGGAEAGGPRYSVALSRPPSGLVLCQIHDHEDSQYGLRMSDEPRYPHEMPTAQISWDAWGQWLPCPSCGASLVWYEAGYVPGYRVCSAAPHHHVRLSADGRSAALV